MKFKCVAGRFTSLFCPSLCPACRNNGRADGEELCPECMSNTPFIQAPFCPSCGGTNDGIFKVCRHCLREESFPWTAATSLMEFRGLAREMIHRLKYSGDTALARPLGLLASRRLSESGFRPDFIVPVPLHWINGLIRGYNQSRLFAEFISAQHSIQTRNVLKRRKWTRRQAKLGRDERKKNIINAFSVPDRKICRNRAILLVDDVFTTGATMRSAAEALLDAGAGEVRILSLARG